jgi:hypothetical protein
MRAALTARLAGLDKADPLVARAVGLVVRALVVAVLSAGPARVHYGAAPTTEGDLEERARVAARLAPGLVCRDLGLDRRELLAGDDAVGSLDRQPVGVGERLALVDGQAEEGRGSPIPFARSCSSTWTA